MAARTTDRTSTADGPQWFDAAPAPIVLLAGAEELFASRALERIVAAFRGREQGIDIHTMDAAGYSRGGLRAATSPSLFAEPTIVVVEHAEAMNDDFLADALDYVASPDPDVVVVIRHGGGVRGKKLLDAMRTANVPTFACAAVKKEGEVVEFAAGEFRRSGKTASAAAVRSLVAAVGTDVSQVAAACGQLIADVEGDITEESVARYYGTRVLATGFAVADAAVTGASAEALSLVRHALETGTDPVPLVAALASKLRILAKVGAARGRGVDPARDEGLAPWQVDRAQRELRHWDADRLAQAIEAVAAADHEVKGAARSPGFAVERAVRRVAELASAR
jgi:DNA polymerase-3 subunit delta